MRGCENRLGWVPNKYMSAERARRQVIDKLLVAVAADPVLVTARNLQLAVEYLYRKRESIASPAYLPVFIPAALEVAVEPVQMSDLDEAVRTAIACEREHERPGYEDWVTRLVRACGPARAAVLKEWRNERHDGVRR